MSDYTIGRIVFAPSDARVREIELTDRALGEIADMWAEGNRLAKENKRLRNFAEWALAFPDSPNMKLRARAALAGEGE